MVQETKREKLHRVSSQRQVTSNQTQKTTYGLSNPRATFRQTPPPYLINNQVKLFTMMDDMDKASASQTPCWDCLSTSESETSAAVVSLYQSWTGYSLCDTKSSSSFVIPQRAQDHDRLATDRLESYTITTTNTMNTLESNDSSSISCDPANGMIEGDDDLTLWGLDDDSSRPTHRDMSGLRQNLSKRLRSEDDIPQVPVLKKRRKPVCNFLNFMGSRRVDPTPPPPVDPCHVEDENPWHLVGLGLEETDALFPMTMFLTEPSTTAFARSSVGTSKNVFMWSDDDDDAKLPFST